MVTAVDASPVGLTKASTLAGERSVQIATVEADLEVWDWPVRAFEAVVGIFFQFAPPDLRRLIFDRCFEALVPGGQFVVQGYRVEQRNHRTGGPPIAENLHTEDQLRAELGRFEVEYLHSHDSELRQGADRDEMSAAIDVVARRPAATTNTTDLRKDGHG